jgi:hypothetical protein
MTAVVAEAEAAAWSRMLEHPASKRPTFGACGLQRDSPSARDLGLACEIRRGAKTFVVAIGPQTLHHPAVVVVVVVVVAVEG